MFLAVAGKQAGPGKDVLWAEEYSTLQSSTYDHPALGLSADPTCPNPEYSLPSIIRIEGCLHGKEAQNELVSKPKPNLRDHR